MNGCDFDLFMNDLKRAVLKLHKDKASRIETYINCEDKKYKVIIEEVKKEILERGEVKDENKKN